MASAENARAATFEEAFAAVEQAAQAAEDAVRKLAGASRRLRKAAREGNVSGIRRDGSQLVSALAAAGEAVTGAATSWPFAQAEEETYLADRYAGELRSAAAALGLNVTRRDEALVCSPSIIRVLPAERALRVDGSKRSAIRPSRVAADLCANQQRAGAGNPQRFLEALFKVYGIVCGRQPRGTLVDSRRLVTMREIYAVFTSRPGSSRQYTRMDFMQQIYLLDTSDVHTTRSGARISFHASTGARATTFAFVDHAGNLIPYYAIRFDEER